MRPHVWSARPNRAPERPSTSDAYPSTRERTACETTARADTGELRANSLGFPALVAQSIALISPTMTAVLIIPLAFSDAGQGTWLAYLFGTVMLLFVVFGLNQFASRSSSAGSMYAYTGKGLGPTFGVLSGWALMWCYLFIGVAGLSGFAIFSNAVPQCDRYKRDAAGDIAVRRQRQRVLVGGLQGHPHLVAPDAGPRGVVRHASSSAWLSSCCSSTGCRSTPAS